MTPRCTPVGVRSAAGGLLLALLIILGSLPALAQTPEPARRPQWDGVPRPSVPDELILHTADEPNIRVRVLTRGLSHPWSLAFLPTGELLVTERDGRLRVIRDGVLDPTPVMGVPEVYTNGSFAGLLEVSAHPRFEQNRQIYLTYTSPGAAGTVVLATARFDGHALHDVREVFRAEPPGIRTSGSRLLFAPDGSLFMAVGGAFDSSAEDARAQNPRLHTGKILRLRDDGTAPADNPFVGRPEYLPEIFSLGHRNPMGLAFHPETGELWAVEHGPQGGDEANVILPGRNYGWPIVSYGRQYTGPRVSSTHWQEGMEMPAVVWLPSVAPSGMIFYTGEAFPRWRGNLFVGAMRVGRIDRTGRIERVVFNANGEEIARESLLTELQQRIRDVRQGPDGLLYVLTEEEDAVLLRIEPVQ